MNDKISQILQWLGVAAALVAAEFGKLDVVFQVLLVVIGLDVVSGAIRAFQQKKLSSEIAQIGIFKKGGELVLVGLAFYVQRLIPGTDIPLAQAMAGFYIYTESLSIVENAAALGVPIPQFLRDALQKLNPDKGIPPAEGDRRASPKKI